MEHFIYRTQIFVIVSGLLIIAGLIKWFYSRKSKPTIDHPLEDIAAMSKIIRSDSDKGFKPTIKKFSGKDKVSGLSNDFNKRVGIKTIKLPSTFSSVEIKFIEEWYSEQGIQQLKNSNGKTFEYICQHPVFEEYSYIDVPGITVSTGVRDSRTLQLISMMEFKTVKLLVLNEWINKEKTCQLN